jgi:hypothetical protein
MAAVRRDVMAPHIQQLSITFRVVEIRHMNWAANS